MTLLNPYITPPEQCFKAWGIVLLSITGIVLLVIYMAQPNSAPRNHIISPNEGIKTNSESIQQQFDLITNHLQVQNVKIENLTLNTQERTRVTREEVANLREVTNQLMSSATLSEQFREETVPFIDEIATLENRLCTSVNTIIPRLDSIEARFNRLPQQPEVLALPPNNLGILTPQQTTEILEKYQQETLTKEIVVKICLDINTFFHS